MTTRVLLVDDQELVRAGFRIILDAQPDVDVIGEAANGQEAIERARQLRPDVICMDVQMPVLDGLAATRAITAESDAAVIMLTTFDRDDYLFEALSAGASGFLLKNSSPEQLVEAVHTIAAGNALLSPVVTRRVIERFAGGAAAPAAERNLERSAALDELTEREREVLHLVAQGLSNTEIARRLYVGEATVKSHVSKILQKLGVRDRIQAVVFAYENGVVVPGG
ncbi:DNA-binding response regulator, NarL/FixJ family, contains REC and HTH domains [Paramicrobacterium humi]|uniref:DNA-binding response regulator, NarL/FixJ family, contains REC and HTH domains n=1 Tax=Paramicrobacterium humi TaxID=640635 RepID=A0A1H4M7D6_9MICO|nr:response regulator transcription factor [Microbacterium humi]SEB78664.1 DNA-binding response regulator, NarL/FixJ family, contains REC and HTH domains [Microbacterium humi]